MQKRKKNQDEVDEGVDELEWKTKDFKDKQDRRKLVLSGNNYYYYYYYYYYY